VTHPALLAIGTATPPGSLDQADAAAHARRVHDARQPTQDTESKADRTIDALYRRAGVRTRPSILVDERGGLPFYPPDGDTGPTTAARNALYAAHAGPLAAEAASHALREADTRQGSITHVVTASCTGFDAPGPDQHLIHTLGLDPAVRRTHVGFMGCHAAINALAVAAAYAAADPAARVLVCCGELCTLHFAYRADPERLVANALFADGAAAAVVAASDDAPIQIARTASTLIPGTADLMAWTIGDHGFEMRLSPKVPDLLARHVPAWTRAWLAGAGLTPADVPSWAIHPGGPRVLSSVRDSLGLAPDADRVSRDVLAEHGNLSSATVLFIIDRMIRAGADLPLAAMAFGPGLAGEGLLLTDAR